MKGKYKLYQVVEIEKNEKNAGSKAPKDITRIASEIGYKKLKVRISRNTPYLYQKINKTVRYFFVWLNIYHKVDFNSIILLQIPSLPQVGKWQCIKKLRKNKNVKVITFIHDINVLRTNNINEYDQREINFVINNSDIMIVHNKNMMKYFLDLRVPLNKLVNLQIFDYLKNKLSKKKKEIDKAVVIAGNLDIRKAGYLKQLYKININFNLYGQNFKNPNYKNLNYKGSFSPNNIPNVLNGEYGLVWDGPSILKCDGCVGNYLKYNDPHKLSLYIVSGLPIIIWKKAAEADFVKEKNIGIVVSNLLNLPKELKKVSSEKYKIMRKNVFQLSKKISAGYYTKQALQKAKEKIINKESK